MSLPWFRLYGEFATDPKVQILSFDDQRHFILVLCLKCNGTLDGEYGNEQLRERSIARSLGLDVAAASEAKRRLVESGLIDADWQPRKWSSRQKPSDSSAERVRKLRQKRTCNGVVTAPKRPSNALDKIRGEKKEKKRVSAECEFPADFALTSDLAAQATARFADCDPEQMFAQFRAHHEARGSRFKNWRQAFTTWVGHAEQFGYPKKRATVRQWD